MIDYQLIRSDRKTLTLYVKPDGRVIVRAPLKVRKQYIDEFVFRKLSWINKTKDKFLKMERIEKKQIHLSPDDVILYKRKAGAFFESRCSYFAEIMGVCYNRISINKAKTRWGSCSSKGYLNFTYRLVFAPPEAIDYVIVHELAHLIEMNHSKSFWAVVSRVMPDYKYRREMLREFQMKVEFMEA